MKIIVTHVSPDLDAITSVWLVKHFLPGWDSAEVGFVPAGERLKNSKFKIQNSKLPEIKNPEDAGGVEKIEGDEVIHVDTGFGKFDHHDKEDLNISAASLVFDYVSKIINLATTKKEALSELVKVVVAIDHFQDLFYQDALKTYQEFSLWSIIEGSKMQYPGNNQKQLGFAMECLDAILRVFENRIWAEKEIREKGRDFMTIWGKGLAIETNNDTVLKLGQKMGYEIVIRKDPNTGFVRIKAKPDQNLESKLQNSELNKSADLTVIFNKLKELDPYASWFLHVSKKMLLNGSSKNPKMVGTKLGLDRIIKVFEQLKNQN